MNVYDFDGTIFNGNSSFKFFMFCAIRNPKIIKYGFYNLKDVIDYKLGILNLEKSNNRSYCEFMVEIDDINILVDKFWQRNIVLIHDWFLKNNKSKDIVVTTSPEFLVKPICDKIGINNVIGTVVDVNTGKIIGKICHGKEKLARLGNIDEFDYYTDDIKLDKPLIDASSNAYLVKRKTLRKIK